VANEQPERRNHDVAEVTCRIVMDVKILVREITPGSVADEFTPSDDLAWEWAERQSRLLRALMCDGEVLNQYLISIAKDDLGALLESDQIEGLPADEEDELFERVYSKLGDEDARFFREARRDGILYENMRLVHKSFVTDWKGAELTELYLIGRRDGGTLSP
jgi:hypothetical protein